MTSLADRLRARIRLHGPLPFVSFMESALYDPEGGYYGAGHARLGRGGDFFTSVSVGPLFGRLLARQFIEMWEHLGRPDRFILAEQGAHDGTLAADVVRALQAFSPECAAATTLYLIEPSAHWRARQEEALAPFTGVKWVRRAAELSGCDGCFYSNELLDAFPVHRVRWDGGEWRELHVALDDESFCFEEGNLSTPALASALERIPSPTAPGFTTEINPEAANWLRENAGALHRGWILTIDYGFPREEYYRSERSEGTLAAYVQHRRVPDPLSHPGEIDLTAHVDFTSLLEAAPACGLRLSGFTDQQRFMAGLGSLHFADTDRVSPERSREQRAFMTLLHPEMMGAAFKSICFEKDVGQAKLSGFHFAEEAHG